MKIGGDRVGGQWNRKKGGPSNYTLLKNGEKRADLTTKNSGTTGTAPEGTQTLQ